MTTITGCLAFRSTERSQASVWKRSLFAITDAVSPGSGAPYSRTAEVLSIAAHPLIGTLVTRPSAALVGGSEIRPAARPLPRAGRLARRPLVVPPSGEISDTLWPGVLGVTAP